MKTRFISLTMLLTCLLAVSSYADDTRNTGSNVGSSEHQNTYIFEEVTVTARKEAEKVQDVSASIDVFSDIEIEDMGGQSFTDLMNYMPNVFPNVNYGINKIVFRGLKGPDSLLWAPSAFYVDGVNYMVAGMRNPDLFDLESLEVLRGPQGTLYGGNSETGLINITTRKPTNEVSASLKGRYSSFNTQNIIGKANVPLIEDKLFVNASFASRKSDGYMKNEYNDEFDSGIDHVNFRGALRWLISDSLILSLTSDHSRHDDEDGNFRIDEGVGKTDRYKIDYNGPNVIENNAGIQALRIDYGGTDFNFVSITTKTNFSSIYDGDGDLTSGVSSYGDMGYYIKRNFDTYTQEFRVSSPESNGPWKWLAGFYGMIQETNTEKNIDMLTWGMSESRNTDVESQNMAIFGQLTYTFAEKFHLTGGLRLDNIHLKGEQDYVGYYGNTSNFDDDIDNSEIIPKVALAYDLTEDAMFYGSVSKGFLAGGFNTAFGSSNEQFTYDTEYMWSYEIGAKTSWLDKRLLINLSTFWQEIKDKQVKMVIATDRWIDNAESARSVGAELSIKARPARGLDLYTGIGYVDAYFTDYETDSTDYKDKTIAFAPDYTFHAGAQYRHASGFFGRLDMTGVTFYYTDPENELECDGYEIFNIKLGYESENWELNLLCKNLFDKEYITDKRQWAQGVIAVADGPPMSAGVDFAMRF